MSTQNYTLIHKKAQPMFIAPLYIYYVHRKEENRKPRIEKKKRKKKEGEEHNKQIEFAV